MVSTDKANSPDTSALINYKHPGVGVTTYSFAILDKYDLSLITSFATIGFCSPAQPYPSLTT